MKRQVENYEFETENLDMEEDLILYLKTETCGMSGQIQNDEDDDFDPDSGDLFTESGTRGELIEEAVKQLEKPTGSYNESFRRRCWRNILEYCIYPHQLEEIEEKDEEDEEEEN